jgi:hypothetical protein
MARWRRWRPRAREGRARSRRTGATALALLVVTGALREAGAEEPARTLAARAANAGMFSLFAQACPDEAVSYRSGREPDGTPSPSWAWQEPGGTAASE